MRYAYPVDVIEDSGVFTVTAPDVPGLVTCGDTRVEALARAEGALVTALSFYVGKGRPVPIPSCNNADLVTVPMLVAAKLALHGTMVRNGVSNVELGRRLGMNEKAARRLRDPLHRSHIGQVEVALRVLGRRAMVEVEAA